MTIDIHIDLLNSFIGEKTAGESATKGAVSTTPRGNRRIFVRRGHKPERKIQWQLIDIVPVYALHVNRIDGL